MHPVDQGVTAGFKAYYLRMILSQAIAAPEEDTAVILEGLQHFDYIKNFT